MVILKSILDDSWKHYLSLERKILARLKKLHKGSIFKRRIGKNLYYYLNLREGKKVISKYLGREKPVELEKEIEERKKLKKQLKEVRENLKMLAKTLKKKRHG